MYAAARLFTTAVFLWVASVQGENAVDRPSTRATSRTSASCSTAPGTSTSPRTATRPQLPVGADGLVQQNAWAFFPLFPMLARGLMLVTRRTVGGRRARCWRSCWAPARCCRSTGRSSRGAPRAVAARPGLPLATVALVSVFPTAAVLQVGVHRGARAAARRGRAAAAPAPRLRVDGARRRRAGVHAGGRAADGRRRRRARRGPLVVVAPRGRHVHLAHGRRARGRWRVLAAASGLPVARRSAAGSRACRTRTCRRRRRGAGSGRSRRSAAGSTCRSSGSARGRCWWWSVGFALVIAVLVVPAAWRLGNELHAWAAAYVVYIAAVVEPGSSLARFLLLAFPLARGDRGRRHAAPGGPALVVRRRRRAHARPAGAVGPADVAREPGGGLAAVIGARDGAGRSSDRWA